MKRLVLCLALLCALKAHQSFAQEEESFVSELDPDTWSLRVGLTYPSIPLTLEPNDMAGLKPFTYDSNENGKFGVGLDYRWFGIYVSLADLAPTNSVHYGNTQYSDLQFHIYTGRLGFDLYYQDFKGYYLDNSRDYDSAAYPGEQRYLRPDIRTSFVGANATYYFSPEKLSMPAAAGNVAFQNRSGGSWSLFAGYGEQKISADSPLAPAGFETSYGAMGNMLEGEFNTAVFGGGYSHNFRWSETWQFLLSAQLGVGPQFQKYKTQSFGRYAGHKFSAKSNSRIGFGQNGKKVFWALQGVIDTTSLAFDQTTLNFLSAQASLFLGQRF